MPSLCDVNVLLALCHEDHVHHPRALQWLDTIHTPAEAVICRISQLGLLRLLNTPAVMLGQPCDVVSAWSVYDAVMADERFVFADEPPELEAALRRMMPSRLVSPRLWQDAYLAAFAYSAGLQFITFDVGFRQFPDLDLVVLSNG